MALTKEELLELKDRMEESKSTISELKGQQTAILAQLKKNFSCNSVEEAETKITLLGNRIAGIDKKIVESSVEIEKQFETE